jgi:hypothetical protein
MILLQYTDPGSLTLIFQILLGIIAAVAFYSKSILKYARTLMGKERKR